MDRNAVTGLVLIMLLTAGYLFFAPKPKPQPKKEPTVITEKVEIPVSDTLPAVLADSLAKKELIDTYSDWANAAQGTDQVFRVKTDLLTVDLQTKGGMIQGAYLNEYETYDSLKLPVIASKRDNMLRFVFDYKKRAIASNELYFVPITPTNNLTVTGDDSLKVILRAKADDNRYIDQVYTFSGNRYDVHYDIVMHGVSKDMVNSFVEMEWKSILPRTELAISNMRQKTFIAYRTGNDVEKMSAKDDDQEAKVNSPVKWVSFKSQFFSGILIAHETFRSGVLKMTTPKESEAVNRVMDARMIADIQKGQETKLGYMFYLGPNEYYTLNSYDLGLQKEMDLGWSFVSYINIGTTYVFKFLENYIGNYGIIIIILAFFIRLLILPLTYRSHVSMAKMRIINETPEIKSLDAKHKDDPQKLQVAKMAIYKEMGVSMFGGCLPMILSYPFLIALFFFFPQAVELRHQSFLWATDLSTYDSIFNLPFNLPFYGDHISLFTLLMAASTWVYTYYQQQSQPTAGAAAAQMKMISYFMPIVLLVFLNNYASGLSLYYLVSNVLSILQTILIRQVVDDKKLLEKMHSFKATNQKKGKPSKSRMETWVDSQQKKQQELMRQRSQPNDSNRRTRRNK